MQFPLPRNQELRLRGYQPLPGGARRRRRNRRRARRAPQPPVRFMKSFRRQQPRGRNRRRRRQGGILQTIKSTAKSVLPFMARAGIARIFGGGDYAIKQNSLCSDGGPPKFGTLDAGFRMKNREYITDISTATLGNFKSQTFALNPGIQQTFPWLSSIAPLFESYKIHGLVFYLNSTSATAVSSTNTALGVWGTVTLYDPSEPDLESKQQCENYVGAQAAVPYESLIHGVECAPKSNQLEVFYVRTGPIATSEDLKFYDLGKTQIFSQGAQASSVIGELWISYDIEFFKPRLPTLGYLAKSDYYNNLTPTTTKPLGTGGSLPFSGSNLGTSITGVNQNIVFPIGAPTGYYAIIYWWKSATVASATTGSLITPDGTNLISTNVLFNFTSASTYTPNLGVINQDRMSSILFVKRLKSSEIGTITFADIAISGGSSYVGSLLITQINPDLISLLENKRVKMKEFGDEFTFSKTEISYLRKLLNRQLEMDIPAIKEEDEDDYEFSQL